MMVTFAGLSVSFQYAGRVTTSVMYNHSNNMSTETFIKPTALFCRVPGEYVPMRRRPVSAGIRAVQRGGHVRRQIGRAGRPVRRRKQRRARQCHRPQQQDGGAAAAAAAGAVNPSPRRLPARPGRVPFPLQERQVPIDRRAVFRPGRMRRRVRRVGLFRLQ